MLGWPTFAVNAELSWGDDRLDDAATWLKENQLGKNATKGSIKQRAATACPSASTARSSLSSGGPTLRAAGHISVHCCLATTPRMATSTTRGVLVSASQTGAEAVHRVRPEVVVEVTFLTWTEANLLRQVSYQGQRTDKPARQVARSI